MSLQEEIKKAVGAHGMWKKRILDAIETGKSDFNPEGVSKDNNCDFGKWLYGTTIPAAAKSMKEYEDCRQLHAKFHTIASGVLKMALEGKKTEAAAAMSSSSDFGKLSTQLTQALMKWAVSAGDM
jgi:hypothetical protein